MIHSHRREHARPDAASVLTKATLRAAEQLGVNNARLARIIGVSESSVSRLGAARTIDPRSKEGELAVLFVRMFRSLDAVFGDTETCRRWLWAANAHLRGVPGELLQSLEGLVDVIRYLDAVRGKV